MFSKVIKQKHPFSEKYKEGIALADFQKVLSNYPFKSEKGNGKKHTPEDIQKINEREKQLKRDATQDQGM